MIRRLLFAVLAMPYITELPPEGKRLLVCLGPGQEFQLPPSGKDTYIVKLCSADAGDGATVKAAGRELLDNGPKYRLVNPWQTMTFIPVLGGYYID